MPEVWIVGNDATRRGRRRAGSARLALLVALASLACATPAVDRTWLEARSPNFVVWSTVGREEAIQLNREFEAFRKALMTLTSIEDFDSRVPTHIVFASGPMSELGLGRESGGYFREDLRANWAVARYEYLEDSDALFHEYIHYLIRNGDGARYPTWFDQGFAEVLSTIRVEDRSVELGHPTPDQMAWLGRGQWMPFAVVIETRDPWSPGSAWREDEVGLYYAQSWLLVHYLHWGRGDRSFGRDNARFLGLVESGTPALVAFEQAFGQPVDELDLRVLDYFRQGVPYHRLTFEKPIETPRPEVRALSRAEVAGSLGDFLLDSDPVRARTLYEAALAEAPGTARSLSGLGRTYAVEGRWVEARARLEQALALGPSDPIVLLDLAHTLREQATQTEDSAARRALLEEARRHYQRAMALQPDSPEALVGLARTYLVDGEDPSRSVRPLEEAHRLQPGSRDVLFGLAVAYASTDRGEEAIPLLERIAAWSHSPVPGATALLCDLRAERGDPCEGVGP